MPNTQCPFCGTVMNQAVKFCVSCQRSVSAEDAAKIGLNIGRNTDPSREAEAPHVSKLRKEFSANRQFRNFFLTLSGILMVCLCYYVTMRFILHEHLPGQLDVLIDRYMQDRQDKSDK